MAKDTIKVIHVDTDKLVWEPECAYENGIWHGGWRKSDAKLAEEDKEFNEAVEQGLEKMKVKENKN